MSRARVFSDEERRMRKSLSQRKYYENHREYYKQKSKEYVRKGVSKECARIYINTKTKRKSRYIGYGICPKCGLGGSKQLSFRLNLNTGNLFNFDININHVAQINGKVRHLRTCYIRSLSHKEGLEILRRGYE